MPIGFNFENGDEPVVSDRSLETFNADRRAAELAADEKAEADYQKQLQRFKQELGMAKEAKEE